VNPKPLIAENHAAKAWSMSLAALGAVAEALQQSMPQIQSAFPQVKWVGPVALCLGLVWNTIQRAQDAAKQAAAL
jgi:uncharacterized protein with HEPN domain